MLDTYIDIIFLKIYSVSKLMEFRYIELILFTLLMHMAIKICVITGKRTSAFWSHFAPWVFTLFLQADF